MIRNRKKTPKKIRKKKNKKCKKMLRNNTNLKNQNNKIENLISGNLFNSKLINKFQMRFCIKFILT